MFARLIYLVILTEKGIFDKTYLLSRNNHHLPCNFSVPMNGIQLLSLNTGLQASLLVDGLGPLVELAVSVGELISETDGNESSPVEPLQSEIQPFAERAKFWVGARAQSEHGKTD